MSCYPETDLMNYMLGRASSPELRRHIAICGKCRKKIARIEESLARESLEIRAQSSSFETTATKPTSIKSRPLKSLAPKTPS